MDRFLAHLGYRSPTLRVFDEKAIREEKEILEKYGHHPVSRKIEHKILPYYISAIRLRKLMFYRLYIMYTYTNDLLVALSGIGIAFPLTLLAREEDQNLRTAITGMPAWLAALTCTSVVLYLGLKTYIVRQEVARKYSLANECVKSFQQAFDLHRILADPTPMPGLDEMQLAVAAVVQKHNAVGAYPPDYTGGRADQTTIAAEVRKQLVVYLRLYGAYWGAPPETERQEPPQ